MLLKERASKRTARLPGFRRSPNHRRLGARPSSRSASNRFRIVLASSAIAAEPAPGAALPRLALLAIPAAEVGADPLRELAREEARACLELGRAAARFLEVRGH
jgi:hypothetical protein